MFLLNLFQMIWIVTAASTIILDAEIGIIIGIVFSVFTVTVRTQRYTTLTYTSQIQNELDINLPNILILIFFVLGHMYTRQGWLKELTFLKVPSVINR